MQYRREIDGLRAIAVIPVILFHAGFQVFGGGYVGVDVFFVISGYLITSILIAELERGDFSVLRFYERRARRILPALFTVLACSLPFGWAWMAPWQFDQFAQSLIAVLFFVSNVIFWLQSGYFDQAADLKPLLHTWSLAVEEQYYLLFPLFLALIWRFGRKRAFWATAALGALSLIIAEYGWRQWSGANFFLISSRAWELLAGSACAFVLAGRAPRGHQVLSLAGLGLILYAIFAFDDTTPFPSLYALAPVGGTALIILFSGPETWSTRLLSLRAFVGLGLISYSAYLWHQPLFAFARIHSIYDPGRGVMTALAAAALVLAWGTWRFVEQPFRGRPARLLPRRGPLFASAGAVAAVLGAVAIWVHLGEGLKFRVPEAVNARTAEIKKLHRTRDTLIRDGECHFSGNGTYTTIGPFLAHWYCLADDESALRPSRVMVFGDSHAADKVFALHSVGIDVGQMTGNSCPLLAMRDTDNACRRLLGEFHDRMAALGATTVLIANALDGPELSLPYLQAVLDDWAARYARVIWFSPMPEFPDYPTIYARMGPKVGRFIRRDLTSADSFARLVPQLRIPANVTIIDTLALFCGTRPDCDPILNGQTLLQDHSHLSQAGARMMGPKIAAALSDILPADQFPGLPEN